MRRTLLATGTAGLLALTFLGVFPHSASAAEPIVRDGTSSAKAAGSCWEIKHNNPTAASGVYWLQTPKLVTAQQFYCDQETDGGGWVLIGRGREGWTFAHSGQGSVATLRNTPSGPSAFTPTALPAATIDGLMNGTEPKDLADGVRLRRAANMTGTTWQENRYYLASLGASKGWSWAFGGGIKLGGATVNGVTTYQTGLHTRDLWVGAGDYNRIYTAELSSHKYKSGFGYGASVAGSSSSTSYLWQYASEKYALPFTQMWIRPQLRDLDYPMLPMEGAPADTQRPMMKTTTEASTTWGVSGVVGGGSGEQNIEVQALAPVGNTIYVGGKFEYVQKGAAPAADQKVRQPYLAAFDLRSGEWRSGFRPALDGQVWDIQATPDGKLIIGGEFSTVNGTASRGLAALDPATGALNTAWRASVADSTSPASTRVRALDVQDGWLYAGGTFNSVDGGITTPRVIKLRNMTRVKVSDGEPDPVWKPTFTAGVIEVDASARGDRVYIVGYFKPSATTPSFTQADGSATVSTSGKGELVPGWKQYTPSNDKKPYQQIVREVGDTFFQGGSEHVLQQINRDTFELLKSNITKNGGDFQSAVEIDGVVYASCHCEHYNYSDSVIWDTYPPSSYSRPDAIKWIGAWDAQTGEYLPEFAISGLRMRAGNGPWELIKDEDGCMWFGGDIRQGSWQSSAYQWLGGFGRVCPRDATAPSQPGAVKATRTTTGVNLVWGGSTDNSGAAPRYEVIRDGRVILTTSGTKYTETGAPANATYWVRAIDGSTNRSATTAGVFVG